jgi:hypothetical protein
MKKAILILPGLMISLISVDGQSPWYTCIITFDNDSCWESPYYAVDIPPSNNIWQVCVPHKTVFDSAFYSFHAILTDSAGPYPVNDTSRFIIKFIIPSGCGCVPVIGAHYKFDSDSLNDFGQVEFSLDHGTTWFNALAISDPYWITPKPVLTGRIHQWTEFAAFIPNYITDDTIYYRFTFISDSIQTNQEGWMLDDILLLDHVEGIGETGSRNEINIYPNPAHNIITLSGKAFNAKIDVSIYDMLGQLCMQETIDKNNEDIDISSLGKGIYMVRVLYQNTFSARMIIKK